MQGGQVSQGPGHDVSGVEELHHGEVAQEEVHGQVKGRAGPCEKDDQRVTQQGGQVDQKHPQKRGPLGRRTPEEEFRQSLIYFSHPFRLEPMV